MGWLSKTLFEYHDGDYEVTTGKGKNKVTRGRKNGVDYVKESKRGTATPAKGKKKEEPKKKGFLGW